LRQPPDKQFILDSLAAIARGAGRPPSRSEFASLSGISEHSVLQFFPNWSAALRAAGLQPYTLNLRLEDRELLEDWGCAVRRNHKIPARRVYRHLGKFDHRTFERRFGPWSQLPEVFRNFARGKPEWADVVALLPVPAPKPVHPGPVGARFSASQALSNPGVPALDEKSPPNSGIAQALLPVPLCRASGSRTRSAGGASPFSPARQGWVKSKKIMSTVGAPPDSPPNRQSPSASSPSKVRYPPLDHRPIYGQPMDFRGLRHEPVNEQGVVLLFGMVAKELGYTVEAVQSGFPDCEAKRQIAPQRWQRVHLEFEFESRNFRDHGHSLTGCDVIVCWRHNWPDCPPQIEILELSSLIKSLPTSAP
jgi:Homing endonuclease associated repeat